MADVTLASTMTAGGTLAVSLAASLSFAVSGTANAVMSEPQLVIETSLESYMSARSELSASLTVENYAFASLIEASANMSVNLSVDRELSAIMLAGGDLAAELGLDLQFGVRGSAEADMKVRFDRGREALGVREVINEIFWLWGIESDCQASDFLRQRALNDLNAALQVLWSQSKNIDYWTRTTLTLNFSTGENTADLTDNIQNVIGTATLDGKPLTPVTTRGEFNNFVDYYLGGFSTGTPVAYYIDRTSQSSKDAANCKLQITPTPATDVDVVLDVILEAPRYDWSDYNAWETIPMPHRYVETLLMPIARYRAMSFQHFIKSERAPMIEREYLEAMAQLGLNDPLTTREEAR